MSDVETFLFSLCFLGDYFLKFLILWFLNMMKCNQMMLKMKGTTTVIPFLTWGINMLTIRKVPIASSSSYPSTFNLHILVHMEVRDSSDQLAV